MQDKRSQYRGYLITGLVIAFLLAFVLLRSVADSYAQEEYLISHLSINEVSDEDKKWHKREADLFPAEQYTDNGIGVSPSPMAIHSTLLRATSSMYGVYEVDNDAK